MEDPMNKLPDEIAKACESLPDDWQIVVRFEHRGWMLELFDEAGETHRYTESSAPRTLFEAIVEAAEEAERVIANRE